MIVIIILKIIKEYIHVKEIIKKNTLFQQEFGYAAFYSINDSVLARVFM
jgi:hypothetical protein